MHDAWAMRTAVGVSLLARRDMLLRPAAVVVGAVAIVTALSCSNGSTATPIVKATRISSSVCEALYDSYLTYLQTCGFPPISIGIPDASVEDVFTVRTELIDHYCSELPALQGTENLQSEMASCTAALTKATSSCGGSPFPLAAACNLAGTLPAEAPCGFAEQCASARCALAPGATSGCGTCGPVAEHGGACTFAGDVSAIDAYCSTNHVWTPFAQEGEPCSGQSVQCELGVTTCADYTSHTCVRLPRDGEPCAVLCPMCAPACAWGSACNGTTCVAAPSPLQPKPRCSSPCRGGDANNDASVFEPCSCGEGAYCPATYDYCQPLRKVGEPCLTTADSPCGATRLGTNTWLDCVDGVCQKPAACR